MTDPQPTTGTPDKPSPPRRREERRTIAAVRRYLRAATKAEHLRALAVERHSAWNAAVESEGR